MRISPITNKTSINTVRKNTYCSGCAVCTAHDYTADSISFQSLATAIVTLVAKNGYQVIRSNAKNAEYKCAILNNVIEKKDIPETLSALAKTSGYQKDVGIWKGIMRDIIDSYSEISYMDIKNMALKTLFSDLPEMPSDSNGGHAAKYEFLSSLVRYGEYLVSPYFYYTIKKLPGTFHNEKISIIKEMLSSRSITTTLENTLVNDEVDKITAKEFDSPLCGVEVSDSGMSMIAEWEHNKKLKEFQERVRPRARANVAALRDTVN